MTVPGKNALTVDVEDYFQVSALAGQFPPSGWSGLELRVERNTHRLLELFADHGCQATFFMLGWVAEHCPGLVAEIAAQGHEVASHGYWHQRASQQSRSEFREDIERAKALLEAQAGREVIGYRAPSFSIGEANSWAFDELAAAGYRYSSSTYPIPHDHYGTPQWPRFAYRCREQLLEIPVSTLDMGGRHWPIGGGGYFRLYPYWLSRWAWRRYLAGEQHPGVFYFHPWEIDPGQPRPDRIGLKTRVRHYLNLDRMESRLQRLLTDFAWGAMAEVFAPQLASLALAGRDEVATAPVTASTEGRYSTPLATIVNREGQ